MRVKRLRFGLLRRGLGEKALRRAESEIRVVGDLHCPSSGSFTQISRGLGLQAPGDASEQKLPVRRSRFLAEDLVVSDAQSGGFQLPKVIDFGKDR
jgi:hypothetical protein